MEQELIAYGLSDKEAKLYLLCLKTGETTANRLIKISGLARGTTYDILERLKVRGLLSAYVKEKATFFKANNPEILVKSLEEKKIAINKIIPSLKKINHSLEETPNIEVLQGLSGVKKILDDILKQAKSVIVMGNEKDAREIILHHPENFRLRRLEKKIKIQNLLEESATARELKNDKFSEVRHTDKLKNSHEVLIIYNYTTVHILMEEPLNIFKIKSKEYTHTQKLLFENLWNSAKK
jgi:sugar-specific transcriptional regulator TrmB